MTAATLLMAIVLKPALVVTCAWGITSRLSRSPAALRHVVWTSAIAATFLLPLLGVVLPPLRITNRAGIVISALATGATLVQSGDWRLSASTRKAVPVINTGDKGRAATSVDESPNSASNAGVLEGAVDSTKLSSVVFAIWMLVASLLTLHRGLAELRVRNIISKARPVSGRIRRLFESVRQARSMTLPVQLFVSDRTFSPAVAGMLPGVILLPSGVEGLPDSEVEAVLLHELGHVARRDCLVNFLADVAKAVYWCNPLVHLAVRRLKMESENACDDFALQSGVEPTLYARLLLHFARGEGTMRALPHSVTAMAGGSELESRLLAVMNRRTPRGGLHTLTKFAYRAAPLLLAAPCAALTFRTAPPAVAELHRREFVAGSVKADNRAASSAGSSRELGRSNDAGAKVAGLATTEFNAPSTAIAAQTTAPGGAVEPDMRANSVASPSSERVPLSPGAYAVSAVARMALAGPDSSVVAQLIEALSHNPVDDADLVRDRAAWALLQVRNGQLVPSLLDSLHSSDWRVQAYAAWALAVSGDTRAVSRLAPLMQHPVWRVRAMAAYALRLSGDARASQAMQAALADEAWQVRVEAAEYFAAIGGPELEVRLRPMLNDRHVAVREVASRVLTPH